MAQVMWIGLLLFLTANTASAAEAEIERRCTSIYPSMTYYFTWKDCVKTQTQQEAWVR